VSRGRHSTHTWRRPTLNLRHTGSALPDAMPDTTLTFPSVSVDVTVDRSLELLRAAETEKSRCSSGGGDLELQPGLRALGALKIRSREHVPAVDGQL